MKKNICRTISIVMLICIACSCLSISAYAMDYDSDTNEYEQIADDIASQYIANPSTDIVPEHTSNSILEIYNQIYEVVYDSETDTFNAAYGGAYVEDDMLIVLYVGNSNDLIEVLDEVLTGKEDVVTFESVTNSYNALYNAKKQMDALMAASKSDTWSGETTNNVINTISQYYIDEQNNKLHITVKPTAETLTMMVAADTSVVSLLGEANQEIIEYEYNDLDFELYSDTETVYPGQAFYNIATNSAGQIIRMSRSSIGLRGQYIGSDGVPHFGFLTVDHGFPYNDYAFVLHGTTLYLLGEAKWGVRNNHLGVDAAFVALEDGYDMTNTVYFSSYYPASGTAACESVSAPSSGGDSIYFRNYYTYMPSGYAIYSNGSTTGRTSGTIVAYDTTINIDGSVFYHYCTVTNPFTHGDSGGVMYSNATSGGTYDSYITVGMVEGGSEADNIAFISTYHRLRTALNENSSSMGDITFLTLY